MLRSVPGADKKLVHARDVVRAERILPKQYVWNIHVTNLLTVSRSAVKEGRIAPAARHSALAPAGSGGAAYVGAGVPALLASRCLSGAKARDFQPPTDEADICSRSDRQRFQPCRKTMMIATCPRQAARFPLRST
jgi:hypothetical protein